jgi:hypothetical protein
MPNMKIKLPLSEQAIADLNDIIAEEKDSPTPAHWLFTNGVKPVLKNTAETRNLIQERGSLELPNGAKITPSDIQNLTLESYPEGNIEIAIGERTKFHIEQNASYLFAINRKLGSPLTWTTAKEWVLESCLSAIAKQMAKLDSDELDAEEKELYPTEKK